MPTGKTPWLLLFESLVLSASLIFNVFQYRQAKDFEPDGTFRAGDLLDEILEQCRFSGDSPPPLRIVADFAAYGAFSYPHKFHDYQELLRRRAAQGTVSYVVPQRRHREYTLRQQFRDFETQKGDPAFLAKLTEYVNSSYGRKALHELLLSERQIKPEELTLDEWIATALAVDDLVIRDLQEWKVKVGFYPHLLNVHAWSGSPHEILVAIVDLQGEVDEASFIARRSVADQMKRILEIIEKGARSTDGSS